FLLVAIGEKRPPKPARRLRQFRVLGLEFDKSKNDNLRSKEAIISKESSKVVAMVVPTNEELVIARDTEQIVKAL
ncbi:MAG: acetate kinase, partial [Bacteroidales bacterium]|nr:acetate kinase [Bacteroidales bacterium]